MAFNLLDTVNGLFSNDLVSKAAANLNEPEGSIQKAISGLVPAALTGILHKASSGTHAAGNILDLAKQASVSGITNNLGNLLGNAGGGTPNLLGMATNIFGDKFGNVANVIASYAGVKSSSASSLLNLAVPAALGAIGKYATQNNLDAGGLMAMLLAQKDKILAAIPSGLGLANALGLGSLSDLGNKVSSTATAVGTEAKKGMGRMWPVLLLLAALALFLLMRKGCNQEGTTTGRDTTTTAMPPMTVDTPVMAMPSFKVKLPDGLELEAMQGGIEDKLVAYLNDPGSKISKDKWFDFDNLNFETGSATIMAESQKQVNNIAAILKAYPKTKIKIGGYTDKTGDAAANKKLSQDRADAVVAALKAAGTNPAQLMGAEGYGAEFAKEPPDASDEQRKKDRRIAVSVRAK